ncbi:hypothetical protein [Brevibacillus laterosporus]|uniref:hypothetical protein n=1 Tax=Brevibacillus laterosporus TaxID=1465 RepID=UPI00264AEA46|nr:hypothetical protein [Brevibacillus laterosporus]MDN9011608.1 hypothetical protein [Brevibacillus laterosporus]MDO0942569.1 hypothetical protein [Brevibacillus laterosporus]
MNALLLVGLLSSSSLDQLGATLVHSLRELHNSNATAIWIPLIYFLFGLGSIYFGHWISLLVVGFFASVIVSQIILLAIDRKNVIILENIFSKQFTHMLSTAECSYCHKPAPLKIGEATILLLAFSIHTLSNKVRAFFHKLPVITISFTASLSNFFTLWMSLAYGEKVRKIKICSLPLGKFGTLISGTIVILCVLEMFL